MHMEEEAFNGGSKAEHCVVGTAEYAAGGREADTGCHLDAKLGQEIASWLPTAEGFRVGAG